MAWRRLVGALVWLAAAGGAGFAVLREVGIARFPFAQLVVVTPWVAAALPVAVLAGALARRRAATAAALAVALVLAVMVVPRALPDRGMPPTEGGTRVRVLSVNAQYGGTDPALVVQRVRERAIDVLSVQELTPAFAAALDAAGLAAELPHRVLRPGEGPSGTGLYARVALRETQLLGPPGLLAQVAATADFGPLRVELVAAHPPAPIPRRLESTWAAELAALPPAPAPDNGTLRILAGDFNATLDHAQLRRLLATGYVDAAAATGAGLRPTWPRDGWPPAILGVTIDHILAGPARRVRVAAYDTWDQPDSDHRAIYADLILISA